MALGIEQNSIAPSLIQNSGNAMSQIIRETGRMVQGHIQEIQTRKDLSAMSQEIQGLVPQSNEFPVQLIQLASRHPLALADERGQMAVQVLGKAHNDWKREQESMQGFGYAPQVGIYSKGTGEVSVPYTPVARQMAPKGFSGVPGGILNKDTGEVAPLPQSMRKSGTSDSQRRAQRTFEVSQLQSELKLLNDEISPLEKRYVELDKAERAFGKQTDDAEKSRVWKGRDEIGPRLQSLGAKREAIKEQIRSLLRTPLETEPTEDTSLGGMVPSELSQGDVAEADASILPPLNANAAEPEIVASPVKVTTTIKRDPKTGKRYEVDLTTKQVIREVP